jgi:hypothetical protein
MSIKNHKKLLTWAKKNNIIEKNPVKEKNNGDYQENI